MPPRAKRTKEMAIVTCGLRECGSAIAQEDGRVEISALARGLVRDARAGRTFVAWTLRSNAKKQVVKLDAMFHSDCYALLELAIESPRSIKTKTARTAKAAADATAAAATATDSADAAAGDAASASSTITSAARSAERATSIAARLSTLTAAEQSVIRDAMDTAEFFDSLSTVRAKAVSVAALLRSAQHACAFTGAGISTSSGIGDYRGKNGMWTELATGVVTDKDGVDYTALRPSYTHEALKKLMDMGIIKYIMSQNCDGLHVLSGVPRESISELHGNIYVEYCATCKKEYVRNFYVCDDTADQLLDSGKSIPATSHVEVCATCQLNHYTGRFCEEAGCSGKLHDTIINFGDDLNEEILQRAFAHSNDCDVMLSLGSSMSVTPANSLVHLKKKRGAASGLVVVNRQPTEKDSLAEKTARIFGDTDAFMRTVMAELLPAAELAAWEAARQQRLEDYARLRTE